jgi:hypothetical protein
MGRHRLRVGASAAVAVVLGSTLAAAAPPPLAGPASGILRQAVSVHRGTPVMSVSQARGLTAATLDGTLAAAFDVNAAAAPADDVQLGLTRIYRNGAVVLDSLGPGWRRPVSATALPPAAISAVMGRAIAAGVGGSSVVMSATSAAMHGAKAGDVVEVYANDGSLVQFTVSQVVPDASTGGSELLLDTGQAEQLGSTGPGFVIVWGTQTSAMDAALAAHGVVNFGREVRIRHSWDPPDPDSTIGLAATKVLLGEPQFTMTPGVDEVQLQQSWVDASIPADRSTLLNGYVYNNCHNRVVADLRGALDEVDAAGLTAALTGGTQGWCFNPRFNRNSPADYLGWLSRHTFAQAMDINTSANCQGCIPPMNCDVVRIFRKHGFAWGGNFARPDGMHFEWVGSRRDLLQYPSRFCPNLPLSAAQTQANGPPPEIGLAGVLAIDAPPTE